MSERDDLRRIGSFVGQELLPAIRDTVLEPIRFSQALKDRLGNPNQVPNYDKLDKVTKALLHVDRFLWSHLSVEIPIAMAAGLAINGNPVAAALAGAGAWMFQGAALRAAHNREQVQN